MYVYEDPDTGIVKAMMGIGMNEDEDKENAFELHFIYVDPAYVRQGIGSEMIRFFEEKGREKGRFSDKKTPSTSCRRRNFFYL